MSVFRHSYFILNFACCFHLRLFYLCFSFPDFSKFWKIEIHKILFKGTNICINSQYQHKAKRENNDSITDAPEIDVEHPIVHTGTGTKSELTCIVHAHPHADVTWHKNDKIINEKKDKRRFLNQKTHRTLVIEHTQESDFGQYTCTAKNPLGRANKTIELTGSYFLNYFYSFSLTGILIKFFFCRHSFTTNIYRWRIRWRRNDATFEMARWELRTDRGIQSKFFIIYSLSFYNYYCR